MISEPKWFTWNIYIRWNIISSLMLLSLMITSGELARHWCILVRLSILVLCIFFSVVCLVSPDSTPGESRTLSSSLYPTLPVLMHDKCQWIILSLLLYSFFSWGQRGFISTVSTSCLWLTERHLSKCIQKWKKICRRQTFSVHSLYQIPAYSLS